jgi:NAD(P)-dependent dehydrogenase (short-subunit alcohol dehydrogenase family)
MPPEGSTVLVTGCSSGFGELMAKTLASHGHHVFATMRDVQSRNTPAADGLRRWAAANQARVEVLELDVTSDASVDGAVQEVMRRTKRVDVLVNNAGVAATGPLEAFSISQVERLFGLNAFGPLRVSNAVLPAMRAQRSGLIVFVTSTLGRVLPRRGGLYAATKWALEGLAESLHYQVAPFGIDVAIVEPGSFPTPATSKAVQAERADIVAAYDELAARPSPSNPHHSVELPNPQDVADAIKTLVDLPPGQRPLRTVVGPVFTAGVADYNATYEHTRDHLAEVLQRPDQAITWTPRARG